MLGTYNLCALVFVLKRNNKNFYITDGVQNFFYIIFTLIPDLLRIFTIISNFSEKKSHPTQIFQKLQFF